MAELMQLVIVGVVSRRGETPDAIFARRTSTIEKIAGGQPVAKSQRGGLPGPLGTERQ